MNQLDANPHAVARPLHGTFDDRVHLQLVRSPEERSRALEPHHRRARHDPESADGRKVSDQRLSHAISEVVLRWIARQIVQGQHGSEVIGGRAVVAAGRKM